MKKTAAISPRFSKGMLIALMLCLPSLTTIQANNPHISNLLTNLSMASSVPGSADYGPELIIESDVVHALWTTWVSGTEGYLFYSRSVDQGATWEAPMQIYQFKEGSRANDPNSRRLAVSGSQVYIAICDYAYYSNGTGYIYLVRSADSGASFTEPTELANSGGGFSALSGCFVRAAGNKVAIVYRDANYNDAFEGLYCLFSSDQGATFNRTSITTTNTNSISDMLYDGDRIVVLHSYAYYYYGLNVGRVYASVSADDGANFTTHKISLTYPSDYGDQERCLSYHDTRYVAKLAKDGNHIHAIFIGNNKQGTWSILYARSTNNGLSFEEAVDINNGHITNIQGGHETVVAAAGNVYLAYLSTSAKVYLVRSANGGTTFEAPADLLTANTYYIQSTWWPQLVIDHNDSSGKTLYFGAGPMMTRKSTNGGENFSGTAFLAPFLASFDVRAAALVIDSDGRQHWLGMGRLGNNDYDIFYGKRRQEPQAGTTKKAYRLETQRYEKNEASIVPSSPDIEFTETMTGEAWVKMLPGSDLTQGIFAKINNADGAFYQGTGYHMFFDDWYGKRRFTSGVITDKGDFINWTSTDVRDTLWHHVAFTYDANGGLYNLKSYLDGILVAEQTVTGNIIAGDGLLLIGSRQPTIHYNSKYMLDDIRLWDRALSQEELIENQVREFTGEEEGLKLWLNFDNTFKDMSGNGNDAIPLYLGELADAGFDPPKVAFDAFVTGKQLATSNKTSNATNYRWNFGDTNTSDKANPLHAYANPGEYLIALTAGNSNSVASKTTRVSVAGLDRVEPTSIGNRGYATIRVFGGGLKPGSTFKLRKDGTEIGPDTTIVVGAAELVGSFYFAGNDTGKYDVVVKSGTAEYVLESALELVPANAPKTWATLSGRGDMLFNMWQTYTITYGNDGNVDAYGVPVYFAISDVPGLEIDLIDFELHASDPDIMNELQEQGITDIEYFLTDSVLGVPFKARVYPLLIPLVRANTSESIRIRIKSNINFEIKLWSTTPWFSPDGNLDKDFINAMAGSGEWTPAWCLGGAAMQLISDGVTGTVGGFIGYARNLYTTIMAHEARQYGDKKWTWLTTVELLSVAATGLVAAGLVVSYTVAWPWVLALNIAINLPLNVGRYAECLETKNLNSSVGMLINLISSRDPNEMVGPAGYGDGNYIRKSNTIPYTIFFENMADATAPAHIVTITDTLDLTVFDISQFGFGAFGWGDTVFSPPAAALREFSMDIDLRPAMELIARVTARLDTLTGIVRWEFLSLNPQTMDIEEDPFVGFLPPNATSPEGEGFVSFYVGLQNSLTTGSEIRNLAEIVFDANEPIVTNEYLNTIDMSTPDSRVHSLSATTPNHFMLEWSGTDAGAGINLYTIYVLVNDTLLYPWITTPETSALFSGEVGYTYKFYSIATDQVGHIEEAPVAFDAWTTLTVGVPQLNSANALFSMYPNPARRQVHLVFSDMVSADVAWVSIYSMSGALVYSRQYTASSPCIIDTANLRDGVYVVKVSAGMQQAIERLVVAK